MHPGGKHFKVYDEALAGVAQWVGASSSTQEGCWLDLVGKPWRCSRWLFPFLPRPLPFSLKAVKNMASGEEKKCIIK